MLPDSLRQHMAVTQHYVYLNHASTSPLPEPTYKVMSDYLATRMAYGLPGLEPWVPKVEEARERVGQLLHVPSDQVAFTRNTSHGLALVAASFPWQPGDNLVIPQTEFIANVYVWKNLERLGVELRFVPAREGRIWPEDVAAAMDERTRLLAVSFVEFQTGYRNDLARLKELCHRRDVAICVDVMQGAGVLPLDVSSLELDFVAAGGQKFLLSPMGIGFLYIKPEWLPRLDRVISGWKGVENPEDYFSYETPFREDIRRYEEGTLSAPLIIGLNESLGLLLDIGIDAIAAHVRSLTDRLIDGLLAQGKRLLTPHQSWTERSAIVSFLPTGDASSLVEALKHAGFIVSERGGAIRVSVHGYNTHDEIDAFLKALEELDREG